MVFAIASGSVVVDKEGRYTVLSLWSLDLAIGEMRRPSGACRSIDSGDVGWWVISKDRVDRVGGVV
jgi:hypothetical protein